MIKSKQVIFLSIAIVFIPLAIFVFYFYDQNISTNIADWASFATFLALIVSVLSLLLISYITYLMSDESLKKPKRWEILNEYLNIIDEINLSNDLVEEQTLRMHNQFDKISEGKSKLQDLDKYIIDLKELFKPYTKLYSFLFYLEKGKSHLFNEDFFEISNYKILFEQTKNFKEYSIKLSKFYLASIYQSDGNYETPKSPDNIDDFNENLNIFMEHLQDNI